MQYSTRLPLLTMALVRLHLLVVVSCLGLALLGRMPDSVAGYLSCPPAVYAVSQEGRRRGRGRRLARVRWARWGAGWAQVRRTWRLPLLRSLVLAGLAQGGVGSVWLIGLPWAVWLWQLSGLLWPWLARQAEWRLTWRLVRLAELWTLRVGVGLALGRAVGVGGVLGREGWPGGPAGGGSSGWGLAGLLWLGPLVAVRHDEVDHCYRAELQGDFSLAVADADPFRRRLLVLFLRLLEVAGEERGSRRTREGRTPFVRQQELAAALAIPQPDISRWEGYWLAGDWRRLLSLHAPQVLTLELQQQIIAAWAQMPLAGITQVHAFLVGHGMAVTESQVRQAAQESGWQAVRSVLAQQCVQQASALRLRDDWLVGDLLRQVAFLLGKVERGEGLTAEEQLDVAAWQKGKASVGLVAKPPLKTLPWLLRVERVVFGQWEALTDGSVRCPDCGSTQVGCKSKKPRQKQYYDEDGALRTVAVYRYYCLNRQCGRGSFTNLPAGLLPYSPYRTEAHLLALQMYGWSRSSYRRTGEALGVASLTAYRWVSAWGQELLPVAALFGVVKSSGVVGIDEKYVLVPKNGKPQGQMRRWMYVYFAVDVYTYDLLHIALFPHNDEASAQAFLLALRTKGYHPRVVVTDLRQDYGPVVTQVFPQAEHHECIFHALKNVQQLVKEVYGADYAQTHPEAVLLKQAVYDIFAAKTKRTAQRRYAAVLTLQAEYVAARPQAAAIFAFLERHWPKLVNAIESDLIATTNNTVELVIRRFDQHYQNFCGFERIDSAQLFLGVFEKLYRFTPFSPDAQPRLRGKSPLQLAGYDITQLPMATLCSGQSIIWPTEVTHVPSL